MRVPPYIEYVARDTFANIVANYPSANFAGRKAFATDMGPRGCPVYSNGSTWRRLFQVQDHTSTVSSIVIGGSGATYTQTGTLVTVTWTAHGIPSLLNNANVHVTQNTGLLATGWYTNFTVVDANNFTFVSTTSQSTSGSLGTNTALTVIPVSYTFPSADGYLLAGDHVTPLAFARSSVTANTKTITFTFGGQQISSAALTTSNVWTQVANVTMLCLTDTTVVVGGLPTLTLANKKIEPRIQLANAADWASVMFSRVVMSPGQ